MKKYKHKLIGNIAIETHSGYNYKVSTSQNFTIPKCIIENSNDWEEVIDKNYEILSFIDISKLIKKKDGLFYRENTQNKGVREDQISHFRINSVLRKSDNCVFTIGDKIDGISYKNIVINSIDLNPNYPQIMFNKLDEGIDLTNAVKSKPILFTTEDGVDIFEGDFSYFLTNNFVLKNKDTYYGGGEHSGWYFSTKEKAEKYILMNKPCLSLNDVGKFYKKLLDFSNGNSQGLKELVKSKLK